MNAKFVKKLEGWNGDARLYSLDTPLDGHDHVIVSGVFAPFSGPETYIFPATSEGECLDFGELRGSFRGDINHSKALTEAGYEVE